VSLCPCGCRGGGNLRVGKPLLVARGFFCATLTEPLGDEKGVSRNAQRGMVMETAPAAALVMAQLHAEIEELRAQFPRMQKLYREVCVLLFFRHGISGWNVIFGVPITVASATSCC